ncbi:MAG: hypothetical protein JJU20_13865 [Opitutales bacterium]|nr:hypothetical protein [Opitutales bacterium]
MNRMLRQFLCLLILSIGAGLLTWAFHPRAPQWTGGWSAEGAVSHAFVESNWDQILWIDARSAREYDEGHMPGAVLVNEDDWEGGLERLFEVWDPGQILVVYCGAEACMTSRAVMHRLREELHEDSVYYLDGGWDLWQATGGASR